MNSVGVAIFRSPILVGLVALFSFGIFDVLGGGGKLKLLLPPVARLSFVKLNKL